MIKKLKIDEIRELNSDIIRHAENINILENNASLTQLLKNQTEYIETISNESEVDKFFHAVYQTRLLCSQVLDELSIIKRKTLYLKKDGINPIDNITDNSTKLESKLTYILYEINILHTIDIIENSTKTSSMKKTISEILDTTLINIENKISSASKQLDKEVHRNIEKIKITIREYEKLSTDKILQSEEGASNRVDVRIRNIDASVSKYQSTVKNAINSFSDAVNDQHESLRGFSKEVRDEVVESINHVSSSGLRDIQLEQSKALNSFNEKAQVEVSKINTKISDEVRQFEAKKEEIELILGEISTQHQSAANTKQADKEEKDANLFRSVGVGWIIFTIFLSIYMFNDYIGLFPIADNKPDVPLNELGLEWFAIRFMTITLLTTPGIYMLKESASHRSKENVYRQRGTQLSSIGAYLGEMAPEERAKLKQDLAMNFFSFHDNKIDTSNVPDFIKNMKEALELAKTLNPHLPAASDKTNRENTQR